MLHEMVKSDKPCRLPLAPFALAQEAPAVCNSRLGSAEAAALLCNRSLGACLGCNQRLQLPCQSLVLLSACAHAHRTWVGAQGHL